MISIRNPYSVERTSIDDETVVDVNEDDLHDRILVTHEMSEENIRNDNAISLPEDQATTSYGKEMSEENIRNDNVISLPEDQATTSYGNLFVIDTTASTTNEIFDYDDILDMLDGSASNGNEVDEATNTAEVESASETIRHWLENFDPNVEGNNSSEPPLMQYF